jgi:predicted RNA methylase
MTKARDLADFISTGAGTGILADGAISVAEVTGLTTELDAKASSTALTTAINGLGTASALDVGTGANQVVQLNGSGQLPALSASNLTGIDGVSAAALIKYGAL